MDKTVTHPIFKQESIIGNYKILEEIGRGGMGVVYRGEQVSLKRQVAIKTLPLKVAHDGEYLRRIENEAKVMAKFTHPNIVYIHERLQHDEIVYLIMEYVPGVTVSEHLKKEGPFEINEAARIIIRVAVALEYAHTKGIIHRDIKPSNIMIRNDNVVKVTDFGIAKSTDTADITRVGGRTPGTRNFMSPEQAQNVRDIDGRTDIYSLGIVFFMMLTGNLPPQPLPDRLPIQSPTYEKIIRRCLAFDRSERYQCASDLVHDLDKAKERLNWIQKANQSFRPFKKKLLTICLITAAICIVLFVWHFGMKKKNENVQSESTEVIPRTAEESEGEQTLFSFFLRSDFERIRSIEMAVDNYRGNNIKQDIRKLLKFKVGFIPITGKYSELVESIKSLFDRMNMVNRVDTGACDVMFSIQSDENESWIEVQSNLFGDKLDKNHEIITLSDEQPPLRALEIMIQKYYCFNIIQALSFFRPGDSRFGATLTLNNGFNNVFKVDDTLNICLNANKPAYPLLLNINSESMYMLFPQAKSDHEVFKFAQQFCTEPMVVTPPTGNELVVVILIAEKSILAIDRYLSEDNMAVIKVPLWPYDLMNPDSAVYFCEDLFVHLLNAQSHEYMISSYFIRTVDK